MLKIIFVYDSLRFKNRVIGGIFLAKSNVIYVTHYKSILLRYLSLGHEVLHYIAYLISDKSYVLHDLIDKYLFINRKMFDNLAAKGVTKKWKTSFHTQIKNQ